MLWIKAIHIFFDVGWFAGLFYLPRIFVNIAQVPEAGTERDRLILMASKLNRFTHRLAGGAVLFGGWLWLGYGIGQGQSWIYAKLALVACLFAFQAACGRQIAALRSGRNIHSHIWYRWFNEIPTVILMGILVLVVVKPF